MSVFWIRERDVEGLDLPGRKWKMLVNELVGCRNITFGVAEFPSGSRPGSHKHDVQEEIIYILDGYGRMISEGKEFPLEPGVTVYVPSGIDHEVVNDGDTTVRLVTLFSPQVVPGSYDKK